MILAAFLAYLVIGSLMAVFRIPPFGPCHRCNSSPWKLPVYRPACPECDDTGIGLRWPRRGTR